MHCPERQLGICRRGSGELPSRASQTGPAEHHSQASAGAGQPGDKVVIALHFNKSHTEDT